MSRNVTHHHHGSLQSSHYFSVIPTLRSWLPPSTTHVLCSVPICVFSDFRLVNLHPHEKQFYQLECDDYEQFLLSLVLKSLVISEAMYVGQHSFSLIPSVRLCRIFVTLLDSFIAVCILSWGCIISQLVYFKVCFPYGLLLCYKTLWVLANIQCNLSTTVVSYRKLSSS